MGHYDEDYEYEDRKREKEFSSTIKNIEKNLLNATVLLKTLQLNQEKEICIMKLEEALFWLKK